MLPLFGASYLGTRITATVTACAHPGWVFHTTDGYPQLCFPEGNGLMFLYHRLRRFCVGKGWILFWHTQVANTTSTNSPGLNTSVVTGGHSVDSLWVWCIRVGSARGPRWRPSCLRGAWVVVEIRYCIYAGKFQVFRACWNTWSIEQCRFVDCLRLAW